MNYIKQHNGRYFFSNLYSGSVAVKNRESLILSSWEEELYKYISGILKNKEQKLLAINGKHDHIHFLIGMKPSCCLSDLVREIKKFTRFKFQWQEGYGAFSYSHSALNNVILYFNNQKQHHKKQTFREVYKDFLTKFEIEHKDEYLFEWIE